MVNAKSRIELKDLATREVSQMRTTIALKRQEDVRIVSENGFT